MFCYWVGCTSTALQSQLLVLLSTWHGSRVASVQHTWYTDGSWPLPTPIITAIPVSLRRFNQNTEGAAPLINTTATVLLCIIVLYLLQYKQTVKLLQYCTCTAVQPIIIAVVRRLGRMVYRKLRVAASVG